MLAKFKGNFNQFLWLSGLKTPSKAIKEVACAPRQLIATVWELRRRSPCRGGASNSGVGPASHPD
jgi:hypothetical protein